MASGAKRVTENMLLSACRALADCSPKAKQGEGPILPPITEIQSVSKHIALKVALAAQQDGVAPQSSEEQIKEVVDANFWKPHYRQYRRASI